VSEQRPARTIYRSAAGAASAAPAVRERAPRTGRRRLRDAWWLAPVLALLALALVFATVAFFLLGGVGLLQYVGITTSGRTYVGTWGSSDPALSAAVVRIVKSGDTYTVSGLRGTGAQPITGRVNDDTLVAGGTTGGVAWQLSLSFVNRDQLRADLTWGDGRAPLETLLTRS
jgi:hypothetical protein